jgi:hypothetical protein
MGVRRVAPRSADGDGGTCVQVNAVSIDFEQIANLLLTARATPDAERGRMEVAWDEEYWPVADDLERIVARIAVLDSRAGATDNRSPFVRSSWS